MSVIIKGNVARIGELQNFRTRTGEDRATVYITIIENHDRPDGHGGYEPDGLTVYRVRFSARMAERVHASFGIGDALLIEATNLRASLDTAPGREPTPVIKARGIDAGLSVRMKAFAQPEPATS
ncbi:hypothetical protein [Nocardia tengchongensis]|uniref:hypothetical protein n=1 Tax=Nocardia tengchongensis TaxID=2055889 RepID=UPI0036135408